MVSRRFGLNFIPFKSLAVKEFKFKVKREKLFKVKPRREKESKLAAVI